jgi:HEAT repeat protein
MSDLETLLRSRKVEDRIRGVKRLANRPLSEAQPLLLKMLADKSGYVAAEAARLLGNGADDDACEAMVTRFEYLSEDGLKRDPGCHVRAALAFAFGRLEQHRAADALRCGIRTVQIEPVAGVPFDTASHLRANCALALAQIQARGALRDIAPLLFDTGQNRVSDPLFQPIPSGTRKAAAQAIGRLGDRNGLVPLGIKLLFPDNESGDVLQECMQAVVDLQDERALSLLVPYLKHHDAALAAYAAIMMLRPRDPEAVAPVLEALPRFRDDLLEAVLLALVSMRTEESEAALNRLRTDRRADIREILERRI